MPSSKRRIGACWTITLVFLLAPGLAQWAGAQTASSSNFVLSQSTLGASGALAVSPSFVFDGTATQPATVGQAGSTSFTLESGFWTSNSVNYTLTVTGTGTGNGVLSGDFITCTVTSSSTSGDCAETTAHGTTLSVTASPTGTSLFAGWSNCDALATTTLADDTCAVVVSRDVTASAGFLTPASISGQVWLDHDGNGAPDTGEPGINGVGVTLSGGSGPDQTVSTAGGGLYDFTDLFPGSYTISIDPATLPVGVLPSFDVDGTGTPYTTVISVLEGENNSSGDFGFQPLADVTITKTDNTTAAVPGLMLTYTIVASNTGPSDDPSVSVSDTFPAVLTNCTWSSSAAGGAGGNTASGTGNISETLSLPVGSAVTYTIDCSIDPAASGSLSNTANIAGLFDPNTANDSATDDDTVLLQLDFGDAPDPLTSTPGQYPTLLANDGARHAVAGPLLGLLRDAEPDGQPAIDATADDLNNQADEDGVNFTDELVLCHTAQLELLVSAAAQLDAWIDYNANGDWSDINEQIFASEPLLAGSNVLSIPVPCDATVGNTYARFRLSTAGGLAPTGVAVDGEIEDYRVFVDDGDGIPSDIEDAAPNNGDGNFDGIPDRNQGSVTSLPNAATGETITLQVSGSCSQIDAVGTATEAELDSDPLYEYPWGLLSFELPCSDADLTVFYHDQTEILPGVEYRKYGPETPTDPATIGFYTLPDVVFDLNNGVMTAAFSLSDGAQGDDNTATGANDGKIIDPAGLAINITTINIPALQPWGIAFLGLLLAGAVALFRRRRL